MSKVIRVNLPLYSPDDTLKLCNKIMVKHNLLDAASPLLGFVDMGVFNTKATDASQKRIDADKLIGSRQRKYHDVIHFCGMAKGQNKDTRDTIYWHLQKVRNTLLLKHKGLEENLSEYGFNVVISQTGSRVNVRVDIPYRNPEDMISLAKDVLAKHTELGGSSPLTDNVDLAGLATLTTDADNLLAEWATDLGSSQALNNDALVTIGYGEGQTSTTDGTLYNMICTVRDRLLDVHQGREEALSEYGFEVVIGSRRKAKKSSSETEIITLEGPLEPSFITNVDIAEYDVAEINTITFSALGSTMRYYASTGLNTPPSGSTLSYELPASTTLQKTFAQMAADLDYTIVNNMLNVMNTGATSGQYRVSIRMK